MEKHLLDPAHEARCFKDVVDMIHRICCEDDPAHVAALIGFACDAIASLGASRIASICIDGGLEV